jgi:hypothetical protein
MATDNDPAIASHQLQTSLLKIQHWLKKWRIKVNGSKSTHVTFTSLGPYKNLQLPQAEDVKYLRLHLDRRLTWHKHIFVKQKQLDILSTKCTGCSEISHTSQATNFASIKPCSSQFELTGYNSGVQLSLPTQKFWNISSRRPCA